MAKKYDFITFISKSFILRRPRIANFDCNHVIIKTTFKDSKRLKELEIMYYNAIHICNSRMTKVADFR